ncbi:TRAP transporter substrate-binding protein DctP [Gynuella sunshinyii]|uniref:TRAP-type C4-dicarboxylate transport system, periplasmic component n=1 Tax=Gynuella sunshinyii YC6258 TaxID=1445510 RepID=A0A0C5V534_9GAMM|nr:TRAP transporter substrate-binding protein DctP [Gynuella sunshinyii]AJQ94585.1 TRAP-type C4-dicarboxylate transport system, periplasmic component [Gynuella sunshinyii YC6258]
MIIRFTLFILSLVLVVPASAVTLKISTAYPDGTAILKEYRAAGKKIEEQTDGRVKVKFYPGGVMGDDKTVKRKVRVGQLSGFMAPISAFADDYKDAQIYNGLLLFRNYDEVDAVRKTLDPIIEAGLTEHGWKTFGVVEGGFAYLMSVNSVTTLDELKQQKFWIPTDDPISENLTKAFGLSPIILNYGEVKTSLETGAINALASPPVAALSFFWYTNIKKITDLPFMYTAAALALDTKAYRKISADDQKLVDAIFTEASQNIDQQNRKDNQAAMKVLLSRGIDLVTPDESNVVELVTSADQANQTLVAEGEFSQKIYDLVKAELVKVRAQ